MRTMYDGIHPELSPGGGALYASYVDGKWPNYLSLQRLWPGARHVSIAVFASDSAHVLDVERFDATPEQAPGWAHARRAEGIVPCVYMSRVVWGECVRQFELQHEPAPLWWVANYDGVPVLPFGAVAKQYRNTAGYDVSVVADYWPGIDPAPKPNTPEDDMPRPLIVAYNKAQWIVAGDLTSRVGLHSPADMNALHATGNYDIADLTDAQMSSIPVVSAGAATPVTP